jgi:hypothetical protein
MGADGRGLLKGISKGVTTWTRFICLGAKDQWYAVVNMITNFLVHKGPRIS